MIVLQSERIKCLPLTFSRTLHLMVFADNELATRYSTLPETASEKITRPWRAINYSKREWRYNTKISGSSILTSCT